MVETLAFQGLGCVQTMEECSAGAKAVGTRGQGLGCVLSIDVEATEKMMTAEGEEPSTKAIKSWRRRPGGTGSGQLLGHVFHRNLFFFFLLIFLMLYFY